MILNFFFWLIIQNMCLVIINCKNIKSEINSLGLTTTMTPSDDGFDMKNTLKNEQNFLNFINPGINDRFKNIGTAVEEVNPPELNYQNTTLMNLVSTTFKKDVESASMLSFHFNILSPEHKIGSSILPQVGKELVTISNIGEATANPFGSQLNEIAGTESFVGSNSNQEDLDTTSNLNEPNTFAFIKVPTDHLESTPAIVKLTPETTKTPSYHVMDRQRRGNWGKTTCYLCQTYADDDFCAMGGDNMTDVMAEQGNCGLVSYKCVNAALYLDPPRILRVRMCDDKIKFWTRTNSSIIKCDTVYCNAYRIEAIPVPGYGDYKSTASNYFITVFVFVITLSSCFYYY